MKELSILFLLLFMGIGVVVIILFTLVKERNGYAPFRKLKRKDEDKYYDITKKRYK